MCVCVIHATNINSHNREESAFTLLMASLTIYWFFKGKLKKKVLQIIVMKSHWKVDILTPVLVRRSRNTSQTQRIRDLGVCD